MEVQTAPRTRLHPLVATAAVAVTLASGVGIAMMTGLMPSGVARQTEPALVSQAAPALGTQSAATARVEAPAVTPAAAPAPAASTAPTSVSAPVAKPAPVVKAAPRQITVAQNAPARPRDEPVQTAPSAAPQPVATTLPPSGSYPAVPPDYRAPVEARNEAPRPAPIVTAKATCFDCGIVESMREVEKKGDGTGLGAIAGGIGGLILGNQVGGGAGNKIATVLGAAGGAYAGHQVEKNARSMKTYEIGVRMESGSYRTIASDSAPTWRAGDHVRIVNGALQSDTR